MTTPVETIRDAATLTFDDGSSNTASTRPSKAAPAKAAPVKDEAPKENKQQAKKGRPTASEAAKKEIAGTLNMAAGLLIMPWSMRDPTCAGVAMECAPEIIDAIAEGIASSERLRKFFEDALDKGWIVRLTLAATPLAQCMVMHHILHRDPMDEETVVNQGDPAAWAEGQNPTRTI